jgi:hypothetical protein
MNFRSLRLIPGLRPSPTLLCKALFEKDKQTHPPLRIDQRKGGRRSGCGACPSLEECSLS